MFDRILGAVAASAIAMAGDAYPARHRPRTHQPASEAARRDDIDRATAKQERKRARRRQEAAATKS